MFLRSGKEQERNAAFLKERYNEALESLRERLEHDGVRLPPDRLPPRFGVQDAGEFLQHTGDLWPSPTWIEDGGRPWLVIGVHETDADKAETSLAVSGRRVMALNPKIHYNRLLTGISAQLLALFVAGLVGIGAYLIALQRCVFRLLYVAFPLGLALAAFLAWIRCVGPYEVNFIHLTAFALVISLAVDYTCIAVSTGFGELERTKILLTGLSTVASFGVLMAARHPVLRAIGATVTLGCGVSLVFALFVRLKEDA
jgi:predicted exporter